MEEPVESPASIAIQKRYSALAETKACLSCGTAASRCEPALGEVCVDLGCGRGAVALRLGARVGPEGRVFGVDVTPAMLEVARARAAEAGLSNVTFISSSFESLDLEGDLAHWVVSNCALNHARDKARVWGEISRVLRPGGRFVVSDIYAVEPIAEQYRDDPVAVAECWAGAETKEAYLEHIAQAGLVEVVVSDESEPYEKAHARLVSFTISGVKPTRPSVAFEGARNPHAKR